MHESCRSRGTSVFDFAGTRRIVPPCTATVQVSVRVGSVSSFCAYFSPRGQELPVTAYFCGSPAAETFVTSSWQPIGHIIHVIVFFSFCSILIYRVLRCFNRDGKRVFYIGKRCFRYFRNLHFAGPHN